MHFVMVETSVGREYIAIGHLMQIVGTGADLARLTLSNGDNIDIQESADSLVARVDNGQMKPGKAF
jgi:hypothetical protein